jgi:hypothetical protein
MTAGRSKPKTEFAQRERGGCAAGRPGLRFGQSTDETARSSRRSLPTPGSEAHSSRYKTLSDRRRRFCNVEMCHCSPRAVRTPRALRAAAMPARLSTPEARMASRIGMTLRLALSMADPIHPVSCNSREPARDPGDAPANRRISEADPGANCTYLQGLVSRPLESPATAACRPRRRRNAASEPRSHSPRDRSARPITRARMADRLRPARRR